MFGEPAPYDFRVLRHHGFMIHAPGPIAALSETDDGASLSVSSWSSAPWYVLINGFSAMPSIKLNGVATPIQFPHQYDQTKGRLLLRLTEPTTIDIAAPAKDVLKIQRGDNTTIKLIWSLAATNYVLEHAASINDASWSQAGGVVQNDGIQNVVATNASTSAEFYRLRRQ